MSANVSALRTLAQALGGIAGDVKLPTEFTGVVGGMFPSNFKESQDLILALRDMGGNMAGWSDGLVGGITHNGNITGAFANTFSNLDDMMQADLQRQTNTLNDAITNTNNTTPRTHVPGSTPPGAPPPPIDGAPAQPVQTQPTDIYKGESDSRIYSRHNPTNIR